MRSLEEDLIKTFIKARILEESRKWSYHMLKKPNLLYKEKTVKFDSGSHLKLLKSTLEHLLALRDAYAGGSATRHVISQTCSRLKRLIARLEKNI
jgi:hypothetical protein